MEASAIPAAKVGLGRTRIAIGAPLLRLRSDEQLVTLFRSGSEDAFRAIHDRYRPRLVAYTRQMLAGSAADAEDAVQEIFVRAYAGLRANDRALALRAWLYRIAHNRCVDELRRPQMVPADELPETASCGGSDPVVQSEQRDALRRLIADVQRLPDQQRSALLMRELGGMTYSDVSGALGVSVPAVKSLLVRARVGLAQASEARDTACERIREDLIVAHDRGVRTSGLARRHMRDCPACRQFRSEVRGVSRQLAAFAPALGPAGMIAKLLGIGGAGGGGAAAGSSAVAGSGAAATTVAGTTGAAASVGAIASASHVVTLLAAAVVTAGGAIELQHIAPPPVTHHHHRVVAHSASPGAAVNAPSSSTGIAGAVAVVNPTPSSTPTDTDTALSPALANGNAVTSSTTARKSRKAGRSRIPTLSLSEQLDPDNLQYATGVTPIPAGPASAGSGSTTATGTSPASTPAATTTSSTTPAPSATGDGTGTSSPSSSASATSSSGAGSTTSSSSSDTAAPATSPSTGSAATGSGRGGAISGGGSAATVRPATSSAPISARSSRSGAKGKHSGTVAIFTMTGN